MKFTLESDGTLVGTRMEFSMTADEIPRMFEERVSPKKHNKMLKRLLRTQPTDVVVSPKLPKSPPVDLVPDPRDN
jgi:hypothetical protein